MPQKKKSRVDVPVRSLDIRVRVTPGTRKESVILEESGRHLVSVKALPKDGRANERVCELIAGHFSVPLNDVHILRGHQTPSKVIRITLKDDRNSIGHQA